MTRKKLSSSSEILVVTGANSVLGMCLVRQARAIRGIRIVATSGSPLSTDLRAGANVELLPGLDLTRPEDLDALGVAVERIPAQRVNLVHAVGAFPRFAPLVDLTAAEVQRIFSANLVTLGLTARVILPHMVRQGGGHVIAFSSHAVSQATPLAICFNAAKAGVEVFMRGLANEYAPFGVHATTLSLSTMDTPQERRLRPRAYRRDWLRPEDVAARTLDVIRAPLQQGGRGDVVQLFNYSDSYFGESYYSRIGQQWPGRRTKRRDLKR